MGFGGFLRQSTAVDVLIGPFVDSANGDDEETGLTIAQADVRLSKNGQAGAQKNDNTTCAHDADGFYNCELDATDTNTVGQLTLWVHVAGALAVRHDYQVLEEATYDIMFAASATGAVPVASIANGAITAAAIATDAIDADALADNAITAATFAANAITSTVVADGAITAAKIADGAIDEATFATTAGSFAPLGIVDQGTAQSATATTLVLRAAAAFANDELIGATIVITGGSAGVGQARTITDYVNATDTATVDTWTTTPTGTITYKIFATAAGAAGGGDATEAKQDTIIALIGTPAADLAADIAAVKAETASIQTDTNAIETDTQDIQSRLPAALVNSRMDCTIDGTGMEAGAVTAVQSGLATAAALDTVDNLLDTEIGALTTAVADLPTNAELATALGTADDAVLAQIALVKAVTDQFTFTETGLVDANVQMINDVTITGDGQPGTEFGV